jgi:hypothetical protein
MSSEPKPLSVSAVAFVAILAALCASCDPSAAPSPAPLEPASAPASKADSDPLPDVVADRFEIKGTLEGNQLTFQLETDLPDNVTVMTDVHRKYLGRSKSGTDTYVPEYWSEKLTVGDARRPQSVALDDAKWVRAASGPRERTGSNSSSSSRAFATAQL